MILERGEGGVERERGRERERERERNMDVREKPQLFASPTCPDWDRALNPLMYRTMLQPIEAHCQGCVI